MDTKKIDLKINGKSIDVSNYLRTIQKNKFNKNGLGLIEIADYSQLLYRIHSILYTCSELLMSEAKIDNFAVGQTIETAIGMFPMFEAELLDKFIEDN